MILELLTSPYKERIEFDNPKTMDEAVRKAILCYQHFKNIGEGLKYWQGKDRNRTVMSTKR